MSEELRKLYCELLAEKIVQMYGIDLKRARHGVAVSAIQELLDEMPGYVDHVPLYCWAEDVYEEMLRNKRQV